MKLYLKSKPPQGAFVADKFEGQGKYQYVDGSCYVGAWAGGRKHGTGVYWDATGGCLQATWAAGALTGPGRYDQPAFTLEGRFVKVLAGVLLLA